MDARKGGLLVCATLKNFAFIQGKARSGVLVPPRMREGISTNQARFFRYELAGLCVLAALGIETLLPRTAVDHGSLLVFGLAALVAGWWGGVLSGAVAMLAGGVLGEIVIFRAPRVLYQPLVSEALYPVLYLSVTAAGLLLIEALRVASERTERATMLAESRAELVRNGMNEISQAEAALRRSEERFQQNAAALEERVQQRTAALEAANRELEAFSYSVSHDLRAPLRSINGFSQALLEEYRDKLDERGMHYLKCACEASERMGQLIENLMSLSRAGECELKRKEVDLTALARQVIDDLQKAAPERKATIRIQPRLRALADEGLLRCALENLLSNAWKFTSRRPGAQIELGSISGPGGDEFYVRDNGAGFDSTQAQNLFGVFQRFHSQKEFGGNGIGLATVKRIFQRHGGDIRAESKPDNGATFYFSFGPA
ncbi:MAG TPA: ATP-binding protein [Candidatus Dormibacteraeota bacterium]|nr:ATP-binding protein [Candidatus Dormibacteraeota bacterium]